MALNMDSVDLASGYTFRELLRELEARRVTVTVTADGALVTTAREPVGEAFQAIIHRFRPALVELLG